MKRHTRAQSILEYVLILGIVGAALFAMQLYFRRGIQAAVKIAADDIGTQNGDEEVDPLRGRRTSRSSEIHRYTSGALASADELAEGATERVRTFTGGGRRVDTYRHTLTTGTSNYAVSEEE